MPAKKQPSLTPGQRRVYDFILARQQEHHLPPTRREITLGLGLASANGIVQHLRELAEKGFVQVQPGKARGIVALVPPGAGDPLRADGRRLSIDVKLLGEIQAGSPADVCAQSGHTFQVDAASMGLSVKSRPFVLRVRGNSMIGAGILDGDYVVFDSTRVPRSNNVVAALIDGESTVKTYVLDGGKPYLKAANPDYPDPVPAWDLEVQGVMVGLHRGKSPDVS